MSTIEQKLHCERELGRIVSIEDELARQRGHKPLWGYGEDGDNLIANCYCTGCGQRMAARVFADGRVWTAGRLRVLSECVDESVEAGYQPSQIDPRENDVSA